jgi:hypothetical protein
MGTWLRALWFRIGWSAGFLGHRCCQIMTCNLSLEIGYKFPSCWLLDHLHLLLPRRVKRYFASRHGIGHWNDAAWNAMSGLPSPRSKLQNQRATLWFYEHFKKAIVCYSTTWTLFLRRWLCSCVLDTKRRTIYLACVIFRLPAPRSQVELLKLHGCSCFGAMVCNVHWIYKLLRRHYMFITSNLSPASL